MYRDWAVSSDQLLMLVLLVLDCELTAAQPPVGEPDLLL